MRRRELILLGVAAAAWPGALRAQQKAMPVIGMLGTGSPKGWAPFGPAFLEGLRETGYVEGQNVVIDHSWAQGHYDRLPALAAELVSRKVDVIVSTGGSPTALALKGATSTIPIVFRHGGDPVGDGLVASLARPGGNLTGISFLNTELAAKRRELLRELVPAATRVAVLVNPSSPSNTEITLRDVEAAARPLGLQIQIFNASTSGEIDAVFANFVRERPDALFVGNDGFFGSRRVQLANLASRHAIPATFANRENAEAGGLMNQSGRCVSPDRRLYRPYPQGRQAGGFAGGAGEQVRAGCQPPNRQDARPHRAAVAALDCRRGDRVSWCGVRYLHLADINLTPVMSAFDPKQTSARPSTIPV
jgi:putative tryptophan/tyrosine transport system substrate-binding protein